MQNHNLHYKRVVPYGMTRLVILYKKTACDPSHFAIFYIDIVKKEYYNIRKQ